MRKTPLKRQSSQKRSAAIANRGIAAAVAARDRGCVHLAPVVCDRSADPHHVWRQGQCGPWEMWNLVCTCRTQHSWIHDHPLVAGSMGFLVPSWTQHRGAQTAEVLRARYRQGWPHLAPWLDPDGVVETIAQHPEFDGAPVLDWVR